MGVTVYTSRLIMQQMPEAELLDLVVKFKNFKNNKDRGTFFGRDTYYTDPFSVKEAQLWHTHLADSNSGSFNLRIAHFNRTSDTALIYCPGYFKKDHILLIAILADAHQIYRSKPNSWFVDYVKIANKFREKK